MRRPLDSAADVARGVVNQAGSSRDVPAAEDVIAAVRQFEQIEFDIPEGTDSDGFLFQYGKVNWFSEPMFTVGFVRQLELVDAGGDHEAYMQVQLEYRYRMDADLEGAQASNLWWFRGTSDSFEEWLNTVEQDPIWGVIRDKIPTEFDISQDLT